jgi:cobalamin biosynthesis protein CobW
VPCTIITGFLGAGKTTLVRHVLENAGGRRLAVIVNEFGDVGIDGEILKSCGVDSCPEDAIVELANGCICCTVADDFVPALKGLLERPNPPEHIVIETSGLALPKPLVQAFAWPEIRARVTVDGVIAVVDAPAVRDGRFADDPDALASQRAADPSLDHDNPLDEVFADQLACADLVVVNKTDLVDAAALDALERELARRARPAAKRIRARFGAVDPAVLLGLAAGAEDDLATRPSHADAAGAHDHDDFESFALVLPPVAEPDALAARLAAAIAAQDVLRVKGFLDVPGKSLRMAVQAVGPRLERWFDRPWRDGEARQSRLVVIGRKGLDRAAIESALAG